MIDDRRGTRVCLGCKKFKNGLEQETSFLAQVRLSCRQRQINGLGRLLLVEQIRLDDLKQLRVETLSLRDYLAADDLAFEAGFDLSQGCGCIQQPQGG
jgi:hypothetical protein